MSELSGVHRSSEIWRADSPPIYFDPDAQQPANQPDANIYFGAPCACSTSLYLRWGLKRFVDIVLASAALLFFLPVLALICVALYFQDGRPLLFRQPRVGRDGKLFGCLKFRTMVRDSDERLRQLLASDPKCREEWTLKQKLYDDPRVHRIGSLLRKSSLDELPQLINVLRGEMSMIGPRPILPEQAKMHGSALAAYTSVRPGLTGLWQVSGRNNLNYSERVSLDLQYISRISVGTDFRILLKTCYVVLIGSGL